LLIGIERELRRKVAGIGTNVLICVGACIFTLISAQVDVGSPSRIASNILTGIGFLGAGLILKESDGHIHGLTTAAGIWLVAAIGMACGYGYYLLALAGTVIATFAPRIPGWLHQHHESAK
jgi:putative Mg2+ transporter-C (MgtC) family protein